MLGATWKGIGPIFTRDLFAAGVRLLVTAIAANELSVSDFASFILITVIATYCDVLFRFKTDQSVGYFIGKKKYSEESIVKTQNTLILLAYVLTCMVLIASQQALHDFLDNAHLSIGLIVTYLLSYCFLMQIYTAHVYLHLFKEDFERYKNMTIISSGTMLLLIVVAKYIYIDLYIILFAQIVGISLAVVYTLPHSKFLHGFRLSFNREKIKEMVSYSGRLYLLNAVGIFQTNYLVTLSSILLSAADTAYVGVIRQFIQLVERVPSFFAQIFYGTLMKSERDNRGLSFTLSKINIFSSLVFLIIIGIAIEPIDLYFFDGKYPDLFKYYWFLSPGICFFCAATPLIQYLNSMGKVSTSTVNYVLAFMASFGVGFLFMEAHSALEVGAMFLVAGSVMFFLTALQAKST